MDPAFLLQAFIRILPGVPLTLQLALSSVLLGAFIALPLVLSRI